MEAQGSKNSLGELRSRIEERGSFYHYAIDDYILRMSVIASLAWYSRIPLEKITITVINGYVILSGTVPWMHQKMVTTLMVQNTKGLKGIVNLIKVVR